MSSLASAEPVVASTCLQWAENIDNLLNDTEGLKLFRSFLAQEYVTHPLDFYLACVGLRKSSQLANDFERLRMVLKTLYRKYLRANSDCFVPISEDTRKSLQAQIAATTAEGLADWVVAVELAQDEVKGLLKRSLYQQFLKSDVYVQHLQQFFPQGSESPATRSGLNEKETTEDGSQMPVAIALPTLHEDHELKPEDIALQPTPSSSFITSTDALGAPASGAKTGAESLRVPHSKGGASNTANLNNSRHSAYYISYYTAVSAVESDRQSLSSEALTSTEADFHSLTDSSIGSSYRQRWHERRQQRQQSSASGQSRRAAGSGRQHHNHHHSYNLLGSMSDAHPTSSTSLRVNNAANNSAVMLQGHQISSSASLRLFSYPQNNDAQLKYQPFIPRGDRPSKLSNLAQENPPEFARILIAKLEKTIADREKDERIERCLRECAANNTDATSADDTSGCNGSISQMSQSGPSVSGKQRSSAKISSSLAKFVQSLSSEQDDTADEHAQSILEEHMARVWDKTLCLDSPAAAYIQPPPVMSMSTSHHYQMYPTTGFPDSHNAFSRSFHATTTPASANRHVGHSQGTPSSRSRKVNNEILSVSSHDSGVIGAQFAGQQVGVQQQQPPVFSVIDSNSLTVPNASTVFVPHGTRHPLHAVSIDPTGHFDSGISIADTESAKSLPPFSSTAKQKVLNWMMHNDKSHNVVTNAGVICTDVTTTVAATFNMPPPPPMINPNTQNSAVAVATLSDSDTQTKSSSTKHRAGGSRSKRSNDSSLRHREAAEESSSSTCGGGGGGTTTTATVTEYTTVAYKFSDEEIPYRSQLQGRNVTLRQFKQLITKRGIFRFYFKHATDEFPGGCVNEEVVDDDAVLPLYDGKIFARVERIDLNATSSANS